MTQQPPMHPNQPAYREGDEPKWWWQVARHLDAAQLASVNAMAHNLDGQTLVFAFQDKLREAQAILWEIFRGKGLLPKGTNGVKDAAANGTGVSPSQQPPNGEVTDEAAALLAAQRAMAAAANAAEASIEPAVPVEVSTDVPIPAEPVVEVAVSTPAEEPVVELPVVPADVPEATPEPAA